MEQFLLWKASPVFLKDFAGGSTYTFHSFAIYINILNVFMSIFCFPYKSMTLRVLLCEAISRSKFWFKTDYAVECTHLYIQSSLPLVLFILLLYFFELSEILENK